MSDWLYEDEKCDENLDTIEDEFMEMAEDLEEHLDTALVDFVVKYAKKHGVTLQGLP